MKCQPVNIRRRRVYFGDLNRQIILHTRSITSPDDYTDYDYSQTLSSPVTVWAAVQTTLGKEIFDGVDALGTITHIFYIKYRSGLTSESFVEWQSEYYRILRLENLDENNEYMALYCNLRGDKTAGVNTQ